MNIITKINVLYICLYFLKQKRSLLIIIAIFPLEVFTILRCSKFGCNNLNLIMTIATVITVIIVTTIVVTVIINI